MTDMVEPLRDMITLGIHQRIGKLYQQAISNYQEHYFLEASYNPFQCLHIDHIGPLPSDDKGNTHILVMIDAFSRWVELFPTKTTGTSEAAGCIFQHFGRFGTPDVIHTDQGPAFRNELFAELTRLSKVEHSFATAYSKEENGIVERANQDVMRHPWYSVS